MFTAHCTLMERSYRMRLNSSGLKSCTDAAPSCSGRGINADHYTRRIAPLRARFDGNATAIVASFGIIEVAASSSRSTARLGTKRRSVRVYATDPANPFDNLFSSSMMRSEVVQKEFFSLLSDIQNLSKVGNKFPEFDVEGKRMFLEKMETALDRFSIFIKRLELAKDDAGVQEFLRFSNAQMMNAGFTLNQFLTRMSAGVEEHRKWLEQEEAVLSDPVKHQQVRAAMRSLWSNSPMGRMDMGDMYNGLSKLDPEVVYKAHSSPQYWVAVKEIMENPSAASKWMDDPDIGPLALELWRAMQSQTWKQQ